MERINNQVLGVKGLTSRTQSKNGQSDWSTGKHKSSSWVGFTFKSDWLRGWPIKKQNQSNTGSFSIVY